MTCPNCAGEIQKLKDETARQKADLERIYALPEAEWASVCAVLMQSLATLARVGYPRMAQESMAALDRGKTYVTKLAAKVERNDTDRERRALYTN